MKKKVLIIISIVLFILFILGLITSYKDNVRVRAGIEPKYVIKLVNDKDLKIIYIGLGYKVIRYVDVNPYGPFGENDSFKYGSWFMSYKKSEKLDINEIQDYINNYFETVKDEDLNNYSYSYVDESKNKVIVGLVDNSKEKQEQFIRNVFTSCCGSKYIETINTFSYIEFIESNDTFKGKVIENNSSSILVEVTNKCKSFKNGDKVLVHISNYEQKNIVYEKDMILTIKFNGMIQETYPPQISSTDISLEINDYNK